MQYATVAVQHGISKLLHRYADWRISATDAEKHCYKNSDSILFTFDDYGTKQQIDTLLNILATKQVKAMFFIQGDWAVTHAARVKKIRAAGHVVGNHTMTHPNLLHLTPKAIQAEIEGGIAGPWFRAPQGRSNHKVRMVAHSLGYVLCYWTIDSRDWTGATVGRMRHTILSELAPGAVILFHMNGLHTRALLPELIDEIRRRGFELTSPSETWLAT